MLRFHRDAAGDPRVHAEKAAWRSLAHWLESDVQGSAALGRKVLAAVDKIAGGHLDAWERTGNAYTLTLSPAGAEIAPQLDSEAEPLHLSLAELREAVARWVAFLDGLDRDH
jgi:uncharacterized protein YacL (UPF0231 family)